MEASRTDTDSFDRLIAGNASNGGKIEPNQDECHETGNSYAVVKDSNFEKGKDLSGRKIDVLLKATGDAPIMKKKKWAVDRNKQVSYLIDFIRKYIKCDASESLFLYINQTFVPSPDQLISNLYECFGTDGKLVLHYCKSQAWG